ncbi:MAG: beta-ketoacyl-[acyl-carrier-protein] synthase II [Candidatus Eremiobacter antarcticus]|nr:beta-ketoacyl-[acyl-carrier-protein] synthase family protein [Candidatus Eremiobacteraeota bacterium]MBC5807920.1 beta-ketoacyl-[acyl-carrier-protein] synthase family protein [Candidatus Eremiobacteraeota bacterium]PZR62711.1 MAG: beta-ketoacyl-[acyl-carrier-protein] synthase II [Candidatus Eremiobacter sp. RRmetagenome_bin22]
MSSKVFITGIGALTPIGIGRPSLWNGALAGKRSVQAVDRFDTSSFRSRVAGQVNGFDAAPFLGRKETQRTERFSQFSIAAAQMAFDDAEYAPRSGDADFGIWIGSALGGVVYAEQQYDIYAKRGLRAVHPMLALSVFGAASCCNVAIHFGLHGPTVSNSNSCAAGAVAIGDAFRAVRDGVCKAALAGGVEAPLAPLTFGAFDIIRSMSTRNDDPAGASRPFDAHRDGFVMAEAACLLLLEREEDVVERGVTPYAEIAGYGLTNDGQHMTAPRQDGREAARAMSKALREAQADPTELDHINSHGSSTPLNDPTESKAIRSVAGTHSDRILISAIKGMMGHALGATGAVEAALCALSIKESMVVPTVNLEQPGDGCDLTYAPPRATPLRQRLVMSNSFGFGGLNAALVFRAA